MTRHVCRAEKKYFVNNEEFVTSFSAHVSSFVLVLIIVIIGGDRWRALLLREQGDCGKRHISLFKFKCKILCICFPCSASRSFVLLSNFRLG